MKTIAIKIAKDTYYTVQNLIISVKNLIKKTSGAIKKGWESFLKDCEKWIFENGCKVIDLEKKDYKIGKAKFECKINDLADFLDNQEEFPEYSKSETIQITRIIEMSKKSYKTFSNNCMMYTNFFGSDFGGTDCLEPLEKLFPKYDWENLDQWEFHNLLEEDKEVKEIWLKNYCQVCALIHCKETGEMIVCNPQGYNYSKYTSFDFSINS